MLILLLDILDSLSESWLWELMGRLHPMVVHFPIGVLITAFFLELLTFGGKRPELKAGIRWLVYIGALSSLVSAAFGLLLAYGGNYPEEILTYHQWGGITTVVFALLTAGMLYRADKSGRRKDLNLYRAIFALTMLLLTFVGHFGASLTHGSDYITSVLPWNYETISEGEFSDLLTEIAEHREMGTVAELHLNELNLGVRRIFTHSCYRCHASDDEVEGGLVLDSEEGVMAGGDGGPIVVPGDPDESEIMRRLLLPQGHDDVMPQKGRALFSDEVELIRTWIELGAHWTDEDIEIFREAELALSKPEPPETDSEFGHPIDRFTDAYFQEQNINWAEPVNDATYMRRVYLDVIGLLPEPEELQAFVTDTTSDKRDRLVDSLLNRDHDYAQHELTFWNDLLRNAYTGTGFITGGRKQITDWLYDALKENKPYDQMVRELVNPDEDSEGFIRGIEWRGAVNASQTTEMQAAQNISQSLLGVNLKCASCHNSFVSNLSLKQAYSFAAVFSDTLLAIERCDVPTGDYAGPGFIYDELGEIEETLPKEERLEQLAEIVTSDKNGRLYRTIVNRYWARLMGRGLVEPTDEMDLEPWNQELLDWLAADLIDHEYNLKYLVSSILRSETYQLPSVAVDEQEAGAREDFVFAGPRRRRLTAEQYVDALSQIAVPVYNSVAYDPYGSNDIEADWVWYDARVDGRQSLPPPGTYYFRHAFNVPEDRQIDEARLLISVDEAFDLYVNGSLAGQGEDWRQVGRIDVTQLLRNGENLLAVEGINRGSTPNPAGVLLSLRINYVDGDMLEVNSNGEWKVINRTPQPGWEEPDFNDSEWDTVRTFGTYKDNSYWGQLVKFTHNQAEERLQFARASLVENDPFMKALGRPPREIVNTTRESEPSLLQALELTNGEVLNEVLSRAADLWMNEYGQDPEEMIDRIYLSAFGRNPTDEEARLAGEMLVPAPDNEAVQDLLWAIVVQPEFQWIY